MLICLGLAALWSYAGSYYPLHFTSKGNTEQKQPAYKTALSFALRQMGLWFEILSFCRPSRPTSSESQAGAWRTSPSGRAGCWNTRWDTSLVLLEACLLWGRMEHPVTRQAITSSWVLRLPGLAMNPMTVHVSTVLQSLAAQLAFVKAAAGGFA